MANTVPAAITYGPDNWGDMDIDCDLITESSFFYTSTLNGFVRQVANNPAKCAWTLDGAANVQGNNIVLPADATVNITSKKTGNEGFVLTISTNPTPPGPPPPPPPPPTPIALADALNNIRYLYPDRPGSLNGVNEGQPGQNFRDHWIDCDRITETATFNVAPTVSTMRSDLLNFQNCTVVTVPNVTPSTAGNAQRRIIGTNGRVEYTNTATGKKLTVFYANVPDATSALSSSIARGVVGQPLTPVKLTAINFTPTGFSVDPALPDGLSIDPVTGEVSGTPTAASQGQYAITASDGSKQGTGILTLEVSATPAYVVTYDQEIGTHPLLGSVTPGQAIVLPTTNSLKDGSVFAGWRTEPAGGGDLIGFAGDFYSPTASLTLYADWKPRARITFTRRSTADPYPIFLPELSPWVDSVGQLILDFVQGSEITLPVPTRENAGFRGWYNTTTCPTTGTQSTLFIGPGGSQVVAPDSSTATWRACWQTSNLTIGFNPRSGTFTGTTSSCSGTSTCNVTWTPGGPLAASGRPQVVTPPAPIRMRYAFKGWFTSQTGGIRVAGPNEPIGVDFSEPSGSSTARSYQAQWTPLIVFDPGEGKEVNDIRCLRESETPRLCLIEWAESTIQLPVPSSSAGSVPTGWFQGSDRQGGPGEMWTQSPYGGVVLTSQWISPPPTPTGLVATPGDGEVSIAFTAGSDGGPTVTNYEYRLDGGSWVAFSPSVSASPVTITGLTNGVLYSVELRGVGSTGAGAPSAAVTVTPEAAATPSPVVVEVVAPPSTTVPPTTVPAPVPGPSGEPTQLAAGEREVLSCAPTDGDGVGASSVDAASCVAESVEVVVENEDQDLVLRGEDFELRLAGECASECRIATDVEGRQTLEFEVGGRVLVSGAGFVPGSLANVWLFSDPKFLGAVEVNPDGSFSGSLPIGEIEVGEHTIQVNGVSADGRTRSVNLGIRIFEAEDPVGVTELPQAGVETDDQIAAWSVLFLALGVLMWLVARRPEEGYTSR